MEQACTSWISILRPAEIGPAETKLCNRLGFYRAYFCRTFGLTRGTLTRLLGAVGKKG